MSPVQAGGARVRLTDEPNQLGVGVVTAKRSDLPEWNNGIAMVTVRFPAAAGQILRAPASCFTLA